MTRIRAFRAGDEPALIALWERCDLVRPWNVPADDIAAKIAFQPELLLVADGDPALGGLAGSVMAGYEGHRGWINYLAVDPGRRRRGIGERLMAVAEQRLLAVGCPKINLQIRRTNLGAVEFYRSLGFVEDEVTSMGKRLIDDAPPSVG